MIRRLYSVPRWLSATEGVLFGYGLITALLGSLWIGLTAVALSLLLIGIDVTLSSYRFRRWRLDRQRSRCPHEFVAVGGGWSRCRRCYGLSSQTPATGIAEEICELVGRLKRGEITAEEYFAAVDVRAERMIRDEVEAHSQRTARKARATS